MVLMKTGLLIHTNGNTEEKIIDMTENTNNISILLEDKLTFIGQILREPDKCNAVIMNGINSKNNEKLKNRSIIPPFNEEVYGDIFIICMDENSEPQDFKMEDLEEYIKNFDEKYKKNYCD
jgi:hypothetical protein